MSYRRRADLGGRLAERLVDGLDDLLAGLERAHGGDHVDHRARRRRRLSPRARRRGPGRAAGAGRRAGDEVVAVLARGRRRLTTSSARGSTRPSRPTVSGLAAAAEDGVALGGHEPALRVGGELAVARVAGAAVGLDGEEALADDREVQRLAGVAGGLRREVGLDRWATCTRCPARRRWRRWRCWRAAARRRRAATCGRPCSRASTAFARSLAIWSWRICSASMPDAAM